MSSVWITLEVIALFAALVVVVEALHFFGNPDNWR